MSGPILEMKDLDVFYGPIQALKKVSLHINEGETVSLIGSNGAGKSTLLMSIFGQPRASGGQILYQGVDITQKSSHYIASNGIAQSPEGRRVFPDMTVEENLLMGTIPIGDKHVDEDMQRMFDLFPRLKERRNQRAMTMSGGEQQMLAIARAMCTRPQIICLDEPAAGLNPQETEALSAMIRLLRDEHDLTVVLIEHDMGMVMSISDHIVVLDHGNVIAEGGPDAIRNDPKVIAAYLGADEEELV